MTWRSVVPTFVFLLLCGTEMVGTGWGVQGVFGGCVQPPDSTPLEHKNVEGREIWMCSNQALLEDGLGRAFASDCGDPSMVEENVACSTETDDSTCAENDVSSSLDGLPKEDIKNGSGETVAKYYKCNPGEAWLSGVHGHLVQCLNGAWQDIFDQCSVDCSRSLPTDCTEIARFGFTTSGTYNIYLNDLSNAALMVWCDLSDIPSDNGWTRVFAYDIDTPSDSSGIAGFDDDYFIGIENLATMSWNYTIERPLVFQFIITIPRTDISGVHRILHATYDNVVVDMASPWTLTVVEDYHGNAGDSFSHHAGKSFDNASQWWEGHDDQNGVKIGPSELKWEGIDLDFSHEIKSIVLRVRPQDYDIDCLLPTDCTEIARIGFTTSGTYNIYLNGLNNPALTVWCDLSDNPGDSGWTRVSAYDTGTPSDSPGIAGFGKDYFIGIENLARMSWNGIIERPLVFQFVITITRTDTSEVYGILHATYGNVVVFSASPWTLTVLEDYHGNAGDSFSHHAWKNFDAASLWWEGHDDQNGVKMDRDELRWEGINVDFPHVIKSIVLQVRQQDYDMEFNCPPEFKFLAHEDNTLIELPISRAENVMMTYQCSGELMKAEVDGTVTSNGSVQCQKEGDSLRWNRIPVLPCSLTCPPDYIKTSDNDSCILLTSERATFGVIGASYWCAKNHGASLAMVSDVMKIEIPTVNQHYYTSHVFRDSQFYPEVSASLTCDGSTSCIGNHQDRCLSIAALSDTQTGRVQNCYLNDTYIMCRLPAKCPDDFFNYKGHCYSIVDYDQQNHILSALDKCNMLGAGLAVPLTMDVLKILATNITRKYNMDTSPEVSPVLEVSDDWVYAFLGISDNNFYIRQEMESDVETLIGSQNPEKPYHYLKAQSKDEIELVKSDIVADGGINIHYAICHLYQFAGCLEDPPEVDPGYNMKREWNGSDLGAIATYRCYPGYFVRGEKSNIIQEMECRGQLGNWFLEEGLSPCEAIDVCSEISDASMSNRENSPSHLHMNGSILFTCPDHMAAILSIEDNQISTKQNLTCMESSPNYFTFSPCLEPCNVCLEELTVGNATTDARSSDIYTTGMIVNVTCIENYMVDVENTTQAVTCTETGWSSAPPCYEACTMPPPSRGSHMEEEVLWNNSIGSQLHYNCLSGYHILNYTGPVESLLVTCESDRTWKPEVQHVECDKVCVNAPVEPQQPAISDWDNITRVIGTVVTLSCPDPLLFDDLNSTITLTCDDNGEWTDIDPTILNCTKKCVDDPPLLPPPGSSSWDEVSKTVGTQVTLSCPENQALPDLNTTLLITCEEDGNWTPIEFVNPECKQVCLEDPQMPLFPGNSTWNGSRFLGTEIEIYCPHPYVFADESETLQLSCDSNNSWTSVDPDILICRRRIQQLPDEPNGTRFEDPGSPYWEGTVLNYTCEENTVSSSGINETSITFNGTSWVKENPEFACLSKCMHPVPDPSDKAVLETSKISFIIGDQVNYTCAGGFDDGNVTITSTCEDESWTIDPVPCCLMCDPPPQPPENVQLTPPNVTSWNSVAIYTCDGEFVNKSSTINNTCEQGNWTLDVIPPCKSPVVI